MYANGTLHAFVKEASVSRSEIKLEEAGSSLLSKETNETLRAVLRPRLHSLQNYYDRRILSKPAASVKISTCLIERQLYLHTAPTLRIIRLITLLTVQKTKIKRKV